MKRVNHDDKKSRKEEKSEVVRAEANNKKGTKSTISSIFKYACAGLIMWKLGTFLYFNYLLFFPPLELDIDHPSDEYVNIMKHEQSFNLTVSFIDVANNIKKRIWFEPNLTYAYSDVYPLAKTFTLPFTQSIRNPLLMAELSTVNLNHLKHRPKSAATFKQNSIVDKPVLTFTSYLPLIKQERKFEIVQNSLLEADMGTEYSIEYTADQRRYPHFKSTAFVALVHDTHSYKEPEFAYRDVNDYERDRGEMYYYPLFYANDVWTLRRDLVRVNESVREVNLTVQFYLVSPGKHLYSRRLGANKNVDLLEELKDMLMSTNMYLLATTLIVSILHMLLDVLSLKSDFQFWLNNKSFTGISVKTLFVQIASDAIILLYLHNSSSQTSTYLLFFMGASLLLNLWKLTRVCSFSLSLSFPFFHVGFEGDYARSETGSYDSVAIRFMSWVLLPCFFAYAAYSLAHDSYKSYYSFFVSTLAGAVYTFGFILMTPQLYINYKLKSVGHLPWRALFYRFLRTIIDDLFSFVIKMPIMHRIACFRDDIIFVLYMIQRYMYKVDPKRTDEEDR
eukprot:TRINITY_DN1474_c0_g2_i2.p1 TRINITY_DN1474_c0_g2~~TRINITY_DN1474_c0_g2_i2.p1  ORF type:complete len:561 (+),score=131.01 TRINITY_DN1474_c0_g2_i2:1811-3493(+)